MPPGYSCTIYHYILLLAVGGMYSGIAAAAAAAFAVPQFVVFRWAPHQLNLHVLTRRDKILDCSIFLFAV